MPSSPSRIRTQCMALLYLKAVRLYRLNKKTVQINPFRSFGHSCRSRKTRYVSITVFPCAAFLKRLLTNRKHIWIGNKRADKRSLQRVERGWMHDVLSLPRADGISQKRTFNQRDVSRVSRMYVCVSAFLSLGFENGVFASVVFADYILRERKWELMTSCWTIQCPVHNYLA